MNAGMPRNEHHNVVCHFRSIGLRLPSKSGTFQNNAPQGHNLSLFSSFATAAITDGTLSELLKYFI